MAQTEWFRNEVWSEEIAAHYFAKLGRARSKDQYLRIQAWYLAETFPEVALELLDHFFLLRDPYHVAEGRCVQAAALVRLRRLEEAVDAYRQALAEERAKPSMKTDAWIELPLLIAMERLQILYPEALTLLVEPEARPVFPVQRFRRMAAYALIQGAAGDLVRARDLARDAIGLAQAERSGLARHPKIGLAAERDRKVLKALEERILA